jgi:hypothetical protein
LLDNDERLVFLGFFSLCGGFGFVVSTRWFVLAVVFWFLIVIQLRFGVAAEFFFTCPAWLHAQGTAVCLWMHVWTVFFFT